MTKISEHYMPLTLTRGRLGGSRPTGDHKQTLDRREINTKSSVTYVRQTAQLPVRSNPFTRSCTSAVIHGYNSSTLHTLSQPRNKHLHHYLRQEDGGSRVLSRLM